MKEAGLADEVTTTVVIWRIHLVAERILSQEKDGLEEADPSEMVLTPILCSLGHSTWITALPLDRGLPSLDGLEEADPSGMMLLKVGA